jgi:RNA polymerase sigma-70 factor, ECF subfamily
LSDSLYNLAHWLTGDRSEAEDLVQETYTKALRGFRSFQEGTNLRAWMFRILRNTFLTSRSGLMARNTSWLEDEDMNVELGTAHTDTPEALLLRQENQQTVVDALESLPPQYREIILLCEVEEFSYREIGEILPLPIGTVMSRIYRAKNALRQTLRAKSPGRSQNAL